MKRDRITVEERLIYRHEVIVEHDMDDERLAHALSEVDRECTYRWDNFDEVVYALSRYGFKVVEVVKSDLSDMVEKEVEIYHVEEVR